MVFSQTPGSLPLAKRKEDEMSIGSTPLAKQPSNQASDYASSPVKTKTVTGRLASQQEWVLHLKETEPFSVLLVTLYHRQCKE